MGEAAKRKDEIVELKKHDMPGNAVIKTAYMVVEWTSSEPQLDSLGAFIVDEVTGDMYYRPIEDAWEPIMQGDLPDWVRKPDTIAKIREGLAVSMEPEKGGKWYRARECNNPNSEIILPS